MIFKNLIEKSPNIGYGVVYMSGNNNVSGKTIIGINNY